MTLADPRTHDDAVVAALVAAGLVVGDGQAPTSHYGWQATPGQSDFTPYAIVYPLDLSFDGSLGCPDTDADFRWQVTCVGSTREQCDWVRNKVNGALVGVSLTVAGRYVPLVRSEGGVGPRRDDTVQPTVFIATPRFTATSV